MKNSKFTDKLFSLKYVLLSALSVFAFSSCEMENAQVEVPLNTEVNLESGKQHQKTPKIVEIYSDGMNFNAPDKIPSGWTTIQYENRTSNTHFFVFEKLPKGKTIEDTRTEVVPVFQEIMDCLNEGGDLACFSGFAALPTWYGKVVFTGGPGLISGGNTAQTTLYLEPGYYVIECYVKSASGMFHSAMGMLDAIVVTEAENGNKEPKPSMMLSISSTEGITIHDEVKPGKRTFSVYFEDQAVYPTGLGHDVHLVRLDDNANIGELKAWMNWANLDGFKRPFPEGVEFLGGTQELPAGETSYFTALLKPGNYAFISEVPYTLMEDGDMYFKTFSVSSKGNSGK